jgi:hypothetical protein
MDEFPQPPANFAILRDAEGREAVRFVGPSGVVPVVATEIPMGAVNLLVRNLKRKLRAPAREPLRVQGKASTNMTVAPVAFTPSTTWAIVRGMN